MQGLNIILLFKVTERIVIPDLIRYPLQVVRVVINMFSPLQFVQLCGSESDALAINGYG